jgi:hypothetical protein
MKVSLLHPSRGRPQKSFNTTREWIEKSGVECELIVSIDNDDPKKTDYIDLYFKEDNADVLLIYNHNKSVVEATNIAGKKSTGDILIYLSDDFKCPDNWGQLVIKEFENENRPLLVKVDDCLQSFHVKVLTIPIMNRALYEKLGYFWHPDYRSMFVDEDLYWTASMMGALKFAPHLKFPHEHHSVGKCANDETYKRSEANWNQGQATFNRRKAMKFPL